MTAKVEGQAGLWQRFQQAGYDYKRPRRGDIVTGTILQIKPKAVVVDIGVKRDGIVPAGDLSKLGEGTASQFKVGQQVPVVIERPQNRHGDLILSIARARELQDWKEAQRLLDTGEVVELQVEGYNRGGVIVRFGLLRGFVPASHLHGSRRGLSSEERQRALANRVGETLRLKAIEVNRRRRRFVLSHRQGERAYREQRKEELMQTLRVGDVVVGRVTSLRSFGAFVDVGGADGLVHISEVSHARVRHPREVLEVGQETEVYVSKLDQQRKRIGLSIKRLLPDPWDDIQARYYSGQRVETKITNVTDFGAFAELEPGVEGLIHISRLSNEYIEKPQQVVSIGDKVVVRILELDLDRRRIRLSLKDSPQK